MRLPWLVLMGLTGSAAMQEAAPVPAELVSGVSGGSREEWGECGFHRVRVYREGWEHVHSGVFPDWIRVDPDGGPLALAASAGVGGIHDAAVRSVLAPEMELQGDAAVVGIVGTHSFTGETALFPVTMTAPGCYRAGQV